MNNELELVDLSTYKKYHPDIPKNDPTVKQSYMPTLEEMWGVTDCEDEFFQRMYGYD